jgi:hypothetical protein
MRKSIVFLIIAILNFPSLLSAAPDKYETVAVVPKAITQVVYVHYASDFNDANTCIFKKFYGALIGYTIDSNGTDTNFKVKFLIDPPEGSRAADQVHELHPLIPTKTCSTATGWYDEVFPWSDYSANTYGSNVKACDVWVGIEDANDATLDDLKIGIIVQLQ